MKAVAIKEFGGPEVLLNMDLPTPEAGRGEIRVKTAYTAVNPVDWKIREGYLKDLLPHSFPLILGWDIAGVVDSVGAGVTGFKVNDKVYAYARKPTVQAGTYAEYVVLDQNAAAKIPAKLTLEQAATIPLAGLTAYQALHDFGSLKKGQKVLVHGGAGGVGSFAVQFAKAAGAYVIATASAANHSYLKELGVDLAVDYRNQDVVAEVLKNSADGMDIVFDAVGGETLAKSYGLVRKGGVLASIVDEPDESRARVRGVGKAGFHFVYPSAEQLVAITKLFDAGQAKVPHYEVMPLEKAREAHEKSQSGRTRGKILLKV